MSFPEPRTLLKEFFATEIGFDLDNRSLKPVHVANGLGRALVERTYDTDALASMLRRWVKNQRRGIDEERNSNQDVLAHWGRAFEPADGRTEIDDRRLSNLRTLAQGVLGADGAVFAQGAKSAYTLANERFLTKDLSDEYAGLFLARLLTAVPDRPEIAADRIRALLRSEDDAVTVLALPLLQFCAPEPYSPSSEVAIRVSKSGHLLTAVDGRLASAQLEELRQAFDRLGRYEEAAGSKLNSLRRMVLFGCFVLHVHVVSSWAARDADAPLPPIVMDFTEDRVRSVGDASRASLVAASQSIEGLARWWVRGNVVSLAGDGEAETRALAAECAESMGTPALLGKFEARATTVPPTMALATTIVEEMLGAAQEHPIGTLTELGRRSGYLSPWANQGRGGKLRKRYTATTEFLETLVAATVDPEEPLEFPEFLQRLRATFGIVVGETQDDETVRRNNLRPDQFLSVTSVNEAEFRTNVSRLRELVIEAGYGRAYADGRTMVTSEPERNL